MPKLDVDEALVRKLAALLEETGLSELEYESGEQRIRVTRPGAGFVAAPVAMHPAAAAAGPVPASAEPQGPPQGAVQSPMVGTAYLAPEPGSANFVRVGQRVSKGDTLLIIEAMKVMNPIAAPQAGTVAEILIADGQPVEYGDVLVVLR